MMVFHSFSNWAYAMGNTLQTFRVHERELDKPLTDLYYRNYVGSEWRVLESFGGYDDDTPLTDSLSWTSLAGDSPTATCYAVFDSDRGYFHDADNANHNDVVFAFTVASSGAGWSKVRMFIDYPTGNETDSDLILYFRDGIGAIAMQFHILNGKVYIMEGINNRVLQIGGVDIDPIGYHDFEFWFNETTKKVQVYFDGTLTVPATGFDDYFNVLAVALANIRFEGNNACDGMDIYFDNISVDWIDTTFDAWLVRLEDTGGDGAIGIDGKHKYTIRIDTTLYPVAGTLRDGDEIERVSDSQLFKITKDQDLSRYINIIRFTLKEVE